jgi:hypothetical protein
VAADAHVDFIRTELQVGTTMLNLAHTESALRDQQAAKKAITNARTALESAKRFLPTLKDVGKGTMGELRRGINELESAIRQYDNAS